MPFQAIHGSLMIFGSNLSVSIIIRDPCQDDEQGPQSSKPEPSKPTPVKPKGKAKGKAKAKVKMSPKKPSTVKSPAKTPTEKPMKRPSTSSASLKRPAAVVEPPATEPAEDAESEENPVKKRPSTSQVPAGVCSKMFF